MARYHGKAGVAYISVSATALASNITLTEWSLDQSTDVVETTSMGDSNKTYVQGLRDIRGTFSGMFDDTEYDTIFDAAESTDGIQVYLYPSSDAATIYWYGPAWLDASIRTGVSAAVEVSGNFVANGAWGRKP
jgi:hypothetical protein